MDKKIHSAVNWVVLLFVITACVVSLAMIDAFAQWHVVLTYALPIPALGLLFTSYRLALQGEDRSSIPIRWIGWMYMLGGISFDMAATIIHSPDLSQEMNPIARILLDSGHALSFVYIYGFVMQGILLIFYCIVWAGFLRHNRLYLKSVYQLGSRSYWFFFKAATGGGNLTWRQWLLPISLNDLPSAYHILWFTAPYLVLGSATYRYLLGLQWFDLFPFVNRILLGGTILGLAFLIEMIWLRYVYTGLKDTKMNSGTNTGSGISF